MRWRIATCGTLFPAAVVGAQRATHRCPAVAVPAATPVSAPETDVRLYAPSPFLSVATCWFAIRQGPIGAGYPPPAAFWPGVSAPVGSGILPLAPLLPAV